MDVQCAELEVLSEAASALGRVRRMHVETHSDEIDEKLPDVIRHAAGYWHQEIAIPLGHVARPRWVRPTSRAAASNFGAAISKLRLD
jgi:hypothetical protein